MNVTNKTSYEMSYRTVQARTVRGQTIHVYTMVVLWVQG